MTDQKKDDPVTFEVVHFKTTEGHYNRRGFIPAGLGLFSSIEGEEESCGQCAPCRIGTRYLRRQVEGYLNRGDAALLSQADEIGWEMEEGSICGLGMTASLPLVTALKHFPEDFGR